MSDPLEMELQMIMICLIKVLGVEPRTSGRAGNALNPETSLCLQNFLKLASNKFLEKILVSDDIKYALIKKKKYGCSVCMYICVMRCSWEPEEGVGSFWDWC